MIAAPIENKKRALARATVEGLVGEIPFAGALIRIYQETHPSAFRKQAETWMEQVSKQVNEHSAQLERLTELLMPTIKISETAAAVALIVCRLSESGLTSDVIQFESIIEGVSEVGRSEIEQALYELQELDYIRVQHAISHRFVRIRPNLDLFRAFDGPLSGTFPDADAVVLAREVLADHTLCNVPMLDARAAWPRRRFNPALEYMLKSVDERLISKEIPADYPTRYFSLDGASEFRLRRLVGDL